MEISKKYGLAFYKEQLNILELLSLNESWRRQDVREAL